MQIMNATEEDKDELLALYHAMIGGPCEWSETYPDENTIAFDLMRPVFLRSFLLGLH